MLQPVLPLSQQRVSPSRPSKIPPKLQSSVRFAAEPSHKYDVPKSWFDRLDGWLSNQAEKGTRIGKAYEKLLIKLSESPSFFRALSFLDRFTQSPVEKANEKFWLDYRQREEIELDDAVHQVLLPSLPKKLRDLNAVGPEMSLEGLHRLYPHLKPKREFFLKHCYELPSGKLAGALAGIDFEIWNMKNIATEDRYKALRKSDEALKHLNDITDFSRIEMKADGSVEAGGKPFISRELMIAQTRGDNLSEETAERLLQWIVKAARIKPHLFYDFDSQPVGESSVLLTPAAESQKVREKQPFAQRWQ